MSISVNGLLPSIFIEVHPWNTDIRPKQATGCVLSRD